MLINSKKVKMSLNEIYIINNYTQYIYSLTEKYLVKILF